MASTRQVPNWRAQLLKLPQLSDEEVDGLGLGGEVGRFGDRTVLDRDGLRMACVLGVLYDSSQANSHKSWFLVPK